MISFLAAKTTRTTLSWSLLLLSSAEFVESDLDLLPVDNSREVTHVLSASVLIFYIVPQPSQLKKERKD